MASGDVLVKEKNFVQIDTSQGVAEARRSGEPGESWTICYPWGETRYHGTPSDLIKRMQRFIAEQEAANNKAA